MSRNFPDRVRPEKVAAAKRRYAGQMSLLAMPRLAELLSNPEPGDEVDFEVGFDVDEQGQLIADVAVSGELPLICQRSLQRYHQPVAGRSRIALIRDADQDKALPDNYEPLVLDDDELSLLELVQEELLLSIPLVPVKPGTESIGDDSGHEDKQGPTHRPFEVLAKMKKSQ